MSTEPKNPFFAFKVKVLIAVSGAITRALCLGDVEAITHTDISLRRQYNKVQADLVGLTLIGLVGTVGYEMALAHGEGGLIRAADVIGAVRQQGPDSEDIADVLNVIATLTIEEGWRMERVQEAIRNACTRREEFKRQEEAEKALVSAQ